MNLADKINVVTGEPDAAEEILGLTAEEANLLGAIEPLVDVMPDEPELSAEDVSDEVLAEAREKVFGSAISSSRIADIPAIDHQVDSVPPAKPIDVLVLTSHIKNPG